MKKVKQPKGNYIPQGPHTEEECRINEYPHCHPSVDCGHVVKSGPGWVGHENDETQEPDEEVGPGFPK